MHGPCYPGSSVMGRSSRAHFITQSHVVWRGIHRPACWKTSSCRYGGKWELRWDWQTRCAYQPQLLETFVDAERHAGTCYLAANWNRVGRTKGRGKLDRRFETSQPVKTVLLRPLSSHATRLLRSG